MNIFALTKIFHNIMLGIQKFCQILSTMRMVVMVSSLTPNQEFESLETHAGSACLCWNYNAWCYIARIKINILFNFLLQLKPQMSYPFTIIIL